METRLYRYYWHLMENGHSRIAKALDLMLMRPHPKFYAVAALLGTLGGFTYGVTH